MNGAMLSWNTDPSWRLPAGYQKHVSYGIMVGMWQWRGRATTFQVLTGHENRPLSHSETDRARDGLVSLMIWQSWNFQKPEGDSRPITRQITRNLWK